jgi:two-component system, NtrC family, response regulator HydG
MKNSQGEGITILAVDDSPDTLELVRRNLQSEGFRVRTATGVSEAVATLEDGGVDLVITDWKMPGASGLDLVRHVHENHADTEVMVITGYASVQGAVDAVKLGAGEYLAKPFTDGELLDAVGRSLDKLHLRRVRTRTIAPDARRYGLIGESRVMSEVHAVIARAARSNATVLVTGESGTGKELVARAVHYDGPRSSAPFVPVNCGGIPEGLLESELFGHMKGAFTGATESRAGFFQTADGGTLFLDEISETSAATQVKLLRALQEKEVCMVGSTRPRAVDVRIVAATNKDLYGLTKSGKFREDLFFRLNVLPITVPPLRERADDVLQLAQVFAERFARELGRAVPQLSERAAQALRAYDWPGNVRELENTVQRVIVMSDADRIEVADLPRLMRFAQSRVGSVNRSLADVEREHILRVVDSVDGNKTRAAQVLGIDRKTLREKLKLVPSSD